MVSDSAFRWQQFVASRTSRSVVLALTLAGAAFTMNACGSTTDTGGGVITPPEAVVGRIDVTAPTSTLSPSQTSQLTAVARTSAGAAVPSAVITWSSSANNVATVNSSGVVTAVAAGAVTITATSGSVTGTVALTVIAAGGTVTAVTVELSDTIVQIGDLTQAKVTARDANGQLIAIGTRPLVWSSSNTAIATVSDGLVSAVGVGTAQIRATVTQGSTQIVGSVALISLTNSDAPAVAEVGMPGLTFSPADVAVKVNGTVRFIFPAMEHNVFWRPSGGGAPADINTTSNRTVSLTFATPGVYPFVCTLHDGMTGRVIVSP